MYKIGRRDQPKKIVIFTSHISRITINDINSRYWIHQGNYMEIDQIENLQQHIKDQSN